MPVELVLPAGGLSSATRKLLRGVLNSPRINEHSEDDRFWSPSAALRHLKQGAHFGEACMKSVASGVAPARVCSLLLGMLNSSRVKKHDADDCFQSESSIP